MRWLIRRVTVILLFLAVVSTVGAVAGRLGDMPNALERIGFGTCDGEACFRGIKLGTDWQKAESALPRAVAEGNSLEIPINMENILSIQVSRETSDQPVQFIGIDLADPDKPKMPSTTAGAIVAQYGPPCRADLYAGNGVPRIMLFIYPTLTVFVDVANGSPPSTTDYRLQPGSPVVGFWIAGTPNDGRCDNATTQYVGPWQGFTSADVYRARFGRASGAN